MTTELSTSTTTVSPTTMESLTTTSDSPTTTPVSPTTMESLTTTSDSPTTTPVSPTTMESLTTTSDSPTTTPVSPTTMDSLTTTDAPITTIDPLTTTTEPTTSAVPTCTNSPASSVLYSAISQEIAGSSDHTVHNDDHSTPSPDTSSAMDFETSDFCPDPDEVPNSSMRRGGGNLRPVAIFTCKPGYTFPDGSTVRSIVCGKDMKWSTKIPGCMAPTCPAIPKHGISVSPAGTKHHISCPENERLANGLSKYVVQCSNRGKWMNYNDGCKGGRCPPPHYLENSSLVIPQNRDWVALGSKITQKCKKGYRLRDGRTSQKIKCAKGFVWTPTDDCLVEVCPPLPKVVHSVRNTKLRTFGTRVVGTCLEGYRFKNGKTMSATVCRGVQGWDRTLPDCEQILCGRPTADSASVHYDGLVYGSTATYTCNTGLRFSDGSDTKIGFCSSHGNWSEEGLVCDKNRCPPIPTLENAKPNSTIAIAGTSVGYMCLPGYGLDGMQRARQNITCHPEQLQWVHQTKMQACSKLHCPKINGTRGHYTPNTTETVYGSHVEVTCDPGYAFESRIDKKTTECLANMSWSLDETCKGLDCGPTPAVPMSVSSSQEYTTYPNNSTYRCIPGYWFKRDLYQVTIQCTTAGMWGATPEACKEIVCLPLPTWDGLVVNTTSTHVGSVVNATCRTGMIFESSHIGYHVTRCGSDGKWTPEPPQCLDLIPLRANQTPVEAEQSTAIGMTTVCALGAVLLVVVILDLPHVYHDLRKGPKPSNIKLPGRDVFRPRTPRKSRRHPRRKRHS